MPWDSVSRLRDEDGYTLWTADASRALAKGEYAGAVEILIECGHERALAERFVAVSLAVNMPRPLTNGSVRLGALVQVARRAMESDGWSFQSVADAVEEAQAQAR